MASSSYMPGNDLEFQVWATRFTDYVVDHVAHFGLSQNEVTALTDGKQPFDDALAAYQTARAAANATSAARTDNRDAFEALIRPVVARIQAFAATTDEDREALGIPVRGQGTPQDIDPSDNKPSALIDIRQRLKHTLRIQNATTTGTSKAKPAGALGAEVWMKVGTPPADETDVSYVGLATRSPFVVDHKNANGNKTAYYQMRWVSSTGEKGAWSEVETATIAA